MFVVPLDDRYVSIEKTKFKEEKEKY